MFITIDHQAETLQPVFVFFVILVFISSEFPGARLKEQC